MMYCFSDMALTEGISGVYVVPDGPTNPHVSDNSNNITSIPPPPTQSDLLYPNLNDSTQESSPEANSNQTAQVLSRPVSARDSFHPSSIKDSSRPSSAKDSSRPLSKHSNKNETSLPQSVLSKTSGDILRAASTSSKKS